MLYYREGYVEVAKILLEAGSDVETPDNYGQSPLFMACWKGNDKPLCICMCIHMPHTHTHRQTDTHTHTHTRTHTYAHAHIYDIIVINDH